jgi:hypothetical protein
VEKGKRRTGHSRRWPTGQHRADPKVIVSYVCPWCRGDHRIDLCPIKLKGSKTVER